MSKARTLFGCIAFLTMLSLSHGAGAAVASSAGTTGSDSKAFSFDMWCLEMQLYPSERCNARRADDVKAYERYRTSVEQFELQRAAREKRDLELRQKLNRDPIGSNPPNAATK
jgi:hypothetical protein